MNKKNKSEKEDVGLVEYVFCRITNCRVFRETCTALEKHGSETNKKKETKRRMIKEVNIYNIG